MRRNLNIATRATGRAREVTLRVMSRVDVVKIEESREAFVSAGSIDVKTACPDDTGALVAGNPNCWQRIRRKVAPELAQARQGG